MSNAATVTVEKIDNKVIVDNNFNNVLPTVQKNKTVVVTAKNYQLQAEKSVNQVKVITTGVPGRDGKDSVGNSGSAEADVNILAGQPVSMNNQGHLVLAKADSSSTMNVVGVCLTDTLATVACKYGFSTVLTLSDWTSVIGSPSLLVGVVYFLSPTSAGMLTPISPVVNHEQQSSSAGDEEKSAGDQSPT